MQSLLRTTLHRLLFPALALAAIQTPAAAQDIWRLHLEDVEVVQQREASGDRPYFAIIQFRSRFGVRGSTQVSVNVPEPHDWVSKPGLRGSLPAGDHMQSGQRTPLPFWTRDTEWRGVTLLPSPFTSPDPARLRAALNTEVIGYAIIGLDNNNTPPHVIQGLADTIGDVLAQALRNNVEPTSALAATAPAFRTTLQNDLQRIAQQAVGFDRVIDVAGQLTVGSTFNPDQLTGVQVRLMPALEGLVFDPRDAVMDQTIGLPTIVTAGPIQAHSVTQSLQPWTETLAFTGSGAQYRVRASLSRAACSAGDLIRTLSVNLLSGDDGLRDNSELQLELNVAGRAPIILPLGGGDGDRRPSAFTRTVTLPTPVPRSALRQVGLRVVQHFSFPETADNWTLNAMQVSSPGGVIVSQTGRPLMRFTGEAGRFMLDTSCTDPSAPAATDPVVSSLRVTLRTGGDDLRGGNDNAFIFVNIAGRSRLELPFNGGVRLPDHSSRSLVIPLPAGVRLSQLRSLGVRATLGGGIGGDNWNIDGVNVTANLTAGGSRTILDQSGNPVVRLTGDSHETTWELRP